MLKPDAIPSPPPITDYSIRFGVPQAHPPVAQPQVAQQVQQQPPQQYQQPPQQQSNLPVPPQVSINSDHHHVPLMTPIVNPSNISDNSSNAQISSQVQSPVLNTTTPSNISPVSESNTQVLNNIKTQNDATSSKVVSTSLPTPTSPPSAPQTPVNNTSKPVPIRTVQVAESSGWCCGSSKQRK